MWGAKKLPLKSRKTVGMMNRDATDAKKDNSDVYSKGPTDTLSLPILNRMQFWFCPSQPLVPELLSCPLIRHRVW